jgi:hypothetical protein
VAISGRQTHRSAPTGGCYCHREGRSDMAISGMARKIAAVVKNTPSQWQAGRHVRLVLFPHTNILPIRCKIINQE